MKKDPVQHLKHSCDPDEFKQYRSGAKTFDVKLNDGVFNLRQGDLLTFEECNPETGELTGDKETKRVGVVLDTKSIANIDPTDLMQKGLSIFSLVSEDHRSLRSLYDHNFTVSVGVDRVDDAENQNEDKWVVLGEPAYTPALGCPDFVKDGILRGININKWPVGRYSVTLLVQVDFDKKEPPFDVIITDIIVLVIAEVENKPDEFEFIEVNPDLLMGGHTLDIRTDHKVVPMSLDDIDRIIAVSMSSDDLQEHPDLISDEEMRKLLADAREKGENVDVLEQVFLANEDEDDDEDFED